MPWRHIGSGGISPPFLTSTLDGRWVVSFTPRPLYPHEETLRYKLPRWAPEPVWTLWRENYFPQRDSNSARVVRSQSLYRLLSTDYTALYHRRWKFSRAPLWEPQNQLILALNSHCRKLMDSFSWSRNSTPSTKADGSFHVLSRSELMDSFSWSRNSTPSTKANGSFHVLSRSVL
jgi:hypothetical protein